MQTDVKPTPNGIVGRVFPCLETVAMAQVVRRFPVVEGLVAILDRSKQGGNQVRAEKAIEGRDRFHAVRLGLVPVKHC